MLKFTVVILSVIRSEADGVGGYCSLAGNDTNSAGCYNGEQCSFLNGGCATGNSCRHVVITPSWLNLNSSPALYSCSSSNVGQTVDIAQAGGNTAMCCQTSNGYQWKYRC